MEDKLSANNSNESNKCESDLKMLQSLVSKHTDTQMCEKDEIDLVMMWRVVWRYKWTVMLISSFFAVASVFYAVSLPNIYKSEALLMPNIQDKQGGALGSLSGQFGGLASLAGINLGGGVDKTVYALEVLKSREFLYKFIEDNDLKPVIMAAENWDLSTNTIMYNSELYDFNSATWTRVVESPLKPEPSLNETYVKFLQQHLSVYHDEKLGMVKLSISHYSPYIAKLLVDKLIDSINDTIKLQTMNEATNSISYLKKELEQTSVAGMQTMFYQLIEQQQKTLMLTKVRDEYVLRTIDAAIVPEKKDKPHRALICIVITLLGGILSLIYVLIRHFTSEKGD